MRLLFSFFFYSFLVFSQGNSLVGDVDCNGELNSEDASLILQYVTSVIDSLPCEQNMIGLTPDQLEEIINLISDSSINTIEETITMISPIYDSATFPDFPTWDTEEGSAIYYADAFRFCEQLNYNDFDDWRLPSLNEMHNYVKENPQSEFIIPNHNTEGWTSFWLTVNKNGPSSGFASTSNLTYAAPIVHISGPTHQTLPNHILFYGAMGTYSMINCFCVR